MPVPPLSAAPIRAASRAIGCADTPAGARLFRFAKYAGQNASPKMPVPQNGIDILTAENDRSEIRTAVLAAENDRSEIRTAVLTAENDQSEIRTAVLAAENDRSEIRTAVRSPKTKDTRDTFIR